jgi:hypothetical protein
VDQTCYIRPLRLQEILLLSRFQYQIGCEFRLEKWARCLPIMVRASEEHFIKARLRVTLLFC